MSLTAKEVSEILDTPWSGQTYSDRIWNNYEEMRKALHESLTQGLVNGTGNAKMTREFKKIYDNKRANISRLIRTESTYVMNRSAVISYIKDGYKRYEFMAYVDGRTSRICIEHDGKTYFLSEALAGINLPPLHPHCRSTIAVEEYLEVFADSLARTGDSGVIELPQTKGMSLSFILKVIGLFHIISEEDTEE
ncbi:minor capsid protein [Listeria weihenstephanensis]|uniref:Minor capsid protein n=1 Tax=Listeria weihenstephanensis TaxID=1006155 RepID=A0A841Z4K7_9LIST|nr:minor capsid protein [Listeria weihenstephanensis]MBC1499397.1 minor capsid protein [Listeria weihenstephanensis]